MHTAIRRSTRLAALSLLLVCGVLAREATTAFAGGGGCHAKTISTAAGVAAEIRGNCYTPTVLHIAPGSSVTWTSRDQVPHTVTGLFNSWGSVEQFTSGQSVNFRFDAAGTFPYLCVVHPSMQGVVVVGDGVASTTQPIVDSVAIAAERAEPALTSFAAPATASPPLLWALGGIVTGVLATSAGVVAGAWRRMRMAGGRRGGA
jgi:plastocyanin